MGLGLVHSFWKYAVIGNKLLIGVNCFPGMCMCVYKSVLDQQKNVINSQFSMLGKLV